MLFYNVFKYEGNKKNWKSKKQLKLLMDSKMENILIIKNLCKAYKKNKTKIQVIENLNLTVEKVNLFQFKEKVVVENQLFLT